MTSPGEVVFLFDVDNTLLDNNRVQADLRRHLERESGTESRDRYWAIFEELRNELGYADYLGALQRYRLGAMNDTRLLTMSMFLVDYPFANRLYPGSLDAIEHVRKWGLTVILSDGDVVFQPRKAQRSGLWESVEGRVLIYIHKEQMLDDVRKRYPARHYVMCDDKLRILAAMKKVWGDQLTTVFPRQGHYALDSKIVAAYPAPDITIKRIGDLVDYDLPALLEPEKDRRGSLIGGTMKATQQLHDLGQSLWLDNITRELLTSGTLRRYVNEFSVTGLTSNPTIFDLAIRNGNAYDDSIRQKTAQGKSGEELFFELAFEDLHQAADLFRPIYDSTNGIDGFVSLEVSPLLAYDTTRTIKEAAQLHARSRRPNVLIKIPGTPEGIPAIEESTFEGVPVNVTLLFSRAQYVAAAEAYMRGIERRIAAGRDPKIHSVASVFVSRWDKAVMGGVPEQLRNRLGIAIAKRTYKSYCDLLESSRWLKLAQAGALPQRLLWGSTGTKDPAAPDIIYIQALAAPDTINTIPEKTLLAFADHGQVKGVMPRDGGDAEAVLAEFSRAGVDDATLAAQLQREGAEAFDQSWNDLMECIATKSRLLKRVG